MKRFFHSCRRRREGLALLAAGVLSGPERTQLETHLATCAECRSYFGDLKATVAPLAQGANIEAMGEPTPAARHRWERAIRSAAAKSQPSVTAEPGLGHWWRDVFWSSRRIWAGLAAVWLLIVAGNLTLRDQPRQMVAQSSAQPKEIMVAYKERQTILSELLGDHLSARTSEAEVPRAMPRPRTENARTLAA